MAKIEIDLTGLEPPEGYLQAFNEVFPLIQKLGEGRIRVELLAYFTYLFEQKNEAVERQLGLLGRKFSITAESQIVEDISNIVDKHRVINFEPPDEPLISPH